MKKYWEQPETTLRRQMVTLFFTIIALSLLLGACTTPGLGQTPVPTPTPQPTPDATLKQQGDTQLQALQQIINQTQQFGGDVVSLQQQYTTDQNNLQSAKTVNSYNTALTTLNGQIDAAKIVEKKAEALSLQAKLKQQVADWGQKNQHYNAFDSKSYPLGFEYGDGGSGGLAQDRIDAANKSLKLEDYQQAVDDLNMYLTNFQAMTNDFTDKNDFTVAHKSDMDLMQSCGKTSGKVIVVSLAEQAMRVYNDGQVVKSFLVTTGRPDRPSLAGCWWVEVKRAPDTFKSGVKEGQPGYYPDTHINYDMMYHSGEYYIHDSWWRADYGPGMNYPHHDSGGDAFADYGSHGCINMPTENTHWLYDYADLNTPIIIY